MSLTIIMHKSSIASMMLQLAIVSCIIFGCTYAKSLADDYISMTGIIMGKSENDTKKDLDACAEMEYPELEDNSYETGMLKCIMDVVNDLCPGAICSGARTSLIYIGRYMVEETKECVDLDGDAEYDPSCHIRMTLKYASLDPDLFELIFWVFYDPHVTEITGCKQERSFQSPASQRMNKNLRTLGDLPPPIKPLHKKRAMDVEKIYEAIIKSRDAGNFSNLKRKLQRFNTN